MLFWDDFREREFSEMFLGGVIRELHQRQIITKENGVVFLA